MSDREKDQILLLWRPDDFDDGEVVEKENLLEGLLVEESNEEEEGWEGNQ